MGAAANAVPSDGWKQVALMLVDLLKRDIVHLDDGAVADEIIASIEPVRKTLAEEVAPLKALVAVGKLDGIINAHNRAVQQQIERVLDQARGLSGDVRSFLELQEPSSKLGEEISSLGTASDTADGNALASVRRNMQEMLNRWKSGLDADTQRTQELNDRLQARIGTLEKVIGESLLQAQRAIAPPDPTDATTGLPKRAQAETAILNACETPDRYVALFYVENMILTNSKFGHSVGDTVLLMASQNLATNLMRSRDTLYRWDGPAFVALIERDADAGAVAGDIHRFSSIQVSQYFDLPYRTVYLPIRMTAETLNPSTLGFTETMDRIERFMGKAASISR